jgi:menaquinol-cytochrome c reductase cytochrome b/c subunit
MAGWLPMMHLKTMSSNMADIPSLTEEIFPKDPGKTYTLAELVRGSTPMVDKGPEDTVFSFPIVLLWEIILVFGISLGIFLFSLIKQAPLDELANPMVTTDPAKAPWYFVGLQELLEHMHPTLAAIVIPTLLVLFLIALPYVDHSWARRGIWFSSPRGRRITGLTALYTLIVMPAYILLDNAFTLRELLRDIAPAWISQWLLPGGILILLVIIPLLVLKRAGANRHEYMLVLFTVMLVSAVVFTVSGFLFRGPGFKLYLPWNMPGGYDPWADF